MSEDGSRVITVKEEIKSEIKEDPESKFIVIEDDEVQVPKSSKKPTDHINTGSDTVATNICHLKDMSSISQDTSSVSGLNSCAILGANSSASSGEAGFNLTPL